MELALEEAFFSNSLDSLSFNSRDSRWFGRVSIWLSYKRDMSQHINRIKRNKTHPHNNKLSTKYSEEQQKELK